VKAVTTTKAVPTVIGTVALMTVPVLGWSRRQKNCSRSSRCYQIWTDACEAGWITPSRRLIQRGQVRLDIVIIVIAVMSTRSEGAFTAGRDDHDGHDDIATSLCAVTRSTPFYPDAAAFPAPVEGDGHTDASQGRGKANQPA
jgi:hypothetical protein